MSSDCVQMRFKKIIWLYGGRGSEVKANGLHSNSTTVDDITVTVNIVIVWCIMNTEQWNALYVCDCTDVFESIAPNSYFGKLEEKRS